MIRQWNIFSIRCTEMGRRIPKSGVSPTPRPARSFPPSVSWCGTRRGKTRIPWSWSPLAKFLNCTLQTQSHMVNPCIPPMWLFMLSEVTIISCACPGLLRNSRRLKREAWWPSGLTGSKTSLLSLSATTYPTDVHWYVCIRFQPSGKIWDYHQMFSFRITSRNTEWTMLISGQCQLISMWSFPLQIVISFSSLSRQMTPTSTCTSLMLLFR